MAPSFHITISTAKYLITIKNKTQVVCKNSVVVSLSVFKDLFISTQLLVALIKKKEIILNK